MALTYATLQTTVMDYLDRSDLTTVLPTFIELFEAKIIRKLRHWRMEAVTTLTTVAAQRYVSLPAGWFETRTIVREGSPRVVMEPLPLPLLDDRSEATGAPNYYNVEGGLLYMDPTPDTEYSLTIAYYKFDALSDSNTTNWLLTYYPDIYVYGTLLEAEAYLMNDPRLPMWKQAFDEAMMDLQKEGRNAKGSGGPLTIRPS